MSLSIVISALVVLGCGEPEAPVEDAKPVAKKKQAPGDANVTNVFAREESDGTWTFHVTVEHADRSWYDYANGWDVVLPDDTSILPDPFHTFTKHIRNPHVGQASFTRTQRDIVIPENTASVRVRAHDKKGGWGGKEVVVDLNVRFGENYSVKRAL